MLGGVEGGPWLEGGGLLVLLFFLGLLGVGESGDPPMPPPPLPGLKSPARAAALPVMPKVNYNWLH